MDLEYLTVAREASAEIEEKKSRFIATVSPVKNEQEANGFVSRVRSKYWDAKHNVYAYYIGGDSECQKFSDDGEPGQTAGMPVLDSVRKLGIRDVAVVVTRYFGGVLLGTGGLVRAYSRSATAGLEAAGIIRMRFCVQTRITIEYDMLGKVQSLISSKGYKTGKTEYTDNVSVEVYVPKPEFEDFAGLVIDACSGRADIEECATTYIASEV